MTPKMLVIRRQNSEHSDWVAGGVSVQSPLLLALGSRGSCPKVDQQLLWVGTRLVGGLLWKKNGWGWGIWVVQSAECPTLDFCLGRDLMVRELEPHVGLWPERRAYLGFSLSLFAPPLHTVFVCAFSLSLSVSLSLK